MRLVVIPSSPPKKPRRMLALDATSSARPSEIMAKAVPPRRVETEPKTMPKSDPNQNAGVSDVVGGSLAAGGARVPWATFEQQAGSAQRIFVRAFKNGQWVTQGQSLNIDQNVEAEAPSIDFAGAGRTVPWDAW